MSGTDDLLLEHIRICRARCEAARTPKGFEWKGSHRVPPLPFFHRKPIKGSCRICDGATGHRGWWCRECTNAYLFWRSPASGKNLFLRQQHHLCALCSMPMLIGVQIDHKIPLYRVKREFGHEPWKWAQLLRYWSPENLQGICDACHKKKNRKEAKERSKYRKAEKLTPDRVLTLRPPTHRVLAN